MIALHMRLFCRITLIPDEAHTLQDTKDSQGWIYEQLDEVQVDRSPLQRVASLHWWLAKC